MMLREGRVGRFALAGGIQVTTDNVLTAVFAMLGMGMWAIILPKLLVAPIWLVMIRYGHAWRPDRIGYGPFLAGWREIARFSRHVIGVEVMTTVQANIDNLLVGYFLGMQALGVYYFAFNAGLGITLGLVNAFGVAVYPHLCQVRAVRSLLSDRYRGSLKTLGMIVVPLVLLQVALAPLYVPLVFGRKWIDAIPVLMIICLSALPRPFASTVSQLLKAVGRPDIELRWQMALTAILTAALMVAAQFSILAVAGAVLAVQAIVLTAFCCTAPRPFVDFRGFGWSKPGSKPVQLIADGGLT
jgi:PST family polysaccharide transporter